MAVEPLRGTGGTGGTGGSSQQQRVSRDRFRVVTGSGDDTLRVWDRARCAWSRAIEEETGQVGGQVGVWVGGWMGACMWA